MPSLFTANILCALVGLLVGMVIGSLLMWAVTPEPVVELRPENGRIVIQEKGTVMVEVD